MNGYQSSIGAKLWNTFGSLLAELMLQMPGRYPLEISARMTTDAQKHPKIGGM